MSRRTVAVVVVAALVLSAGCIGGSGSGPGAETSPPTGTAGGDTGTVHFYVSDEPNAIEDFRHLNVTISASGLHQVGGATTSTNGTSVNETETPADGTATPAEGDGDGDGDGDWVEYEVNETVDLTELVGANATKLDVLDAPAGTYDKVFVYVDEIHAVLENGEEVNVKLPSEKLHLDKQFEVGNGEVVDFVFDIAVHEAGNSGKYILKPVVSQSGTGDEVEIEESGSDDDGDDGDDEKTGDVEAEFVGPVDPGSEATVKVTGQDGLLAGATVEVDGEVIGQTGDDGTVTFEVPPDAEKVEVTVRKGDAETELEREFDDRGNGNGNGAVTKIAG